MTLLSSLIIFISLSGQVMAAKSEGSINCTSLPNTFGTVTLKNRHMSMSGQNEGAMWDVVATVVGEEDIESEVTAGKIRYFEAEANYAPRKYKNHSKFDLTKLVDTKSFGSFAPSNDCYLYFLMPNNGLAKKSFIAPMSVSCEHGGTTIRLLCKVTARQ